MIIFSLKRRRKTRFLTCRQRHKLLNLRHGGRREAVRSLQRGTIVARLRPAVAAAVSARHSPVLAHARADLHDFGLAQGAIVDPV